MEDTMLLHEFLGRILNPSSHLLDPSFLPSVILFIWRRTLSTPHHPLGDDYEIGGTVLLNIARM